MKSLKRIPILAVCAVLSLAAQENLWFELNGGSAGRVASNAVTRILPETGTCVIVCDGKSSCYQAPEVAELPEQFTWAVWFRPEQQAGNGALICKVGYHNALLVNKEGRFGFLYYLASKKIRHLFLKPLPTGRWYFGTLVCDGKSVELYLNGEKAARHTLPEKLINGRSYYFFGALSSNAAPVDHFQGELNGIRLWNSALSSAEVMELYLAEKERYSLP